MKKIVVGTLAVLAIGVTLILYCCIHVGAQADRWLEVNGEDTEHEGRESG